MGILSLTMGLMGLALCQANGLVANSKQVCLGMFPLGTEDECRIMLVDMGGGSAELAWGIGMGLGGGSVESAQSVGECLVTLVVILLTVVLTSCLSSILERFLSSSSNCKGLEETWSTEGEGPDSNKAVLGIGESQSASGSLNLLMTLLMSCCHRTAFPEGEGDGA